MKDDIIIHGFGFWLFRKRFAFNLMPLDNGKLFIEITLFGKVKHFTI